VHAVDLSPVSLAHAQYNAELAGVSYHICFALGSWDAPLRAAGLQGQLGGLLSNPPYIPRAQMSSLQQEVRCHESHLALDGGDGPGMDALKVEAVPLYSDFTVSKSRIHCSIKVVHILGSYVLNPSGHLRLSSGHVGTRWFLGAGGMSH
jgi:methylase of polypeptide subunit release factors